MVQNVDCNVLFGEYSDKNVHYNEHLFIIYEIISNNNLFRWTLPGWELGKVSVA